MQIPGGSQAESTPGLPGPAAPECGFTTLDACVGAAITAFFRGLVADALNPLLGLLSDTLLTTPDPGSLPGLSGLWNGSWQILLATYGLLVLLAGIVVMAHETLQSRTTVKEILPRLLVGFLAGAASFGIAGQAVAVANALTRALLGDGLDPSTAGASLRDLILTSIQQNYFLILVAVLLVGMIVALLIGFVIRVAVTIILIAGAPLALMFHALPQTEGIAWWWWRAFGACLAIQIAQSLALVTALRVFLAPGAFTPFGPTRSGAVGMLVALALAWVIYRVPFWVLTVVHRSGGGRRSLVGSLIRSYLVYRAFGMLTGRRRAGGSAGRPSGPGAGPWGPGGGWGPGRGPRPRPGGPGGGSRAPGGAGPSTGAEDPYGRVRATAQGQYVLPLPDLHRSAPAPRPGSAAPPAGAGRGAASPRRGRQLVLPLGGERPEQRPVVGRDGQYRLPIPVPRAAARPRPAPTSSTTTSASAARPPRRRAGTQLQLPLDPYRGVRANGAGQYPLPLDVQRSPRPAPSPAPVPVTPPPAAAAGSRVVPGRQLRLPLDLPRRPRPPRRSEPPQESPSTPPPASPPSSSPSSPPPRPSRSRRRSSS